MYTYAQDLKPPMLFWCRNWSQTPAVQCTGMQMTSTTERETLESGLIQTPDLSSKVRVHGQATSVFPQGPLSTMLKLLLMPLTLSAVRFFDSGLLFCVRWTTTFCLCFISRESLNRWSQAFWSFRTDSLAQGIAVAYDFSQPALQFTNFDLQWMNCDIEQSTVSR